MFEYKKAIQAHLGPQAMAMGKAAVAAHLGIKSNFVTAILSDKDPYEVLPVSCLPALETLCGLSAAEGLRLLSLRVSDSSSTTYARHAKPRVGLDRDTLDWIIASARATSPGVQRRGLARATDLSGRHTARTASA
jgi:hypothetical protein